MATDTILTISQITPESLMVLENSLPFASQVSREYDSSFGVEGAKIGDTLNVRRPPRFIGTSGPALAVEDYNQTSVPVVLGDTTKYGDQFHVDVSFTTKDLRLSLGAFSDNVIKPAVAAIANHVEYDGLLMAKNSTANIVGTYGSPSASLLTYLQAGAYLDNEAAPRDGKRAIVTDPITGATIVDGLKGLFMPDAKISEQYRTGLMGRDSSGMNWKMGQNVANQTTGAWAAGSASTLTANTSDAGTLATGWASTSTITLTFGATVTLKKGDVISIAGVYPVNPQSRKQYGTTTKKFVVTTDFSGTGASTGNLTVSPAIITGGQFQNCVVTTSSATATVTPFSIGVSAVGNFGTNSIMFHKNAFTLATADLPLPEGVDFAGRSASKEAGLSIRVVRQYTINNDQIPTRFDVLYGWAPLYQELATRVAG